MRRIRLWEILAKCCVVMLLVAFSGLLWAQQGATESLAGKYRSAMELYEKGSYVQARKLLLSVKESIETAGTKVTPETIKAIDAKLADIDAKLKLVVEEAPPVVEDTPPVVEAVPEAEETLAPVGEETAETGAAATETGDAASADERFEKLRRDPNILKGLMVREKAARTVRMPRTGEDDAGRFRRALQDENVRRQRIEEEVRAKLVEGLVLLGQNRFEDASRKFLSSQTQVRYADFSDAWKKLWLGRIQEHLDMGVTKRKGYVAKLHDTEALVAAVELQKHLDRMRALQGRQFIRLIEQWEIFFGRKQYDDALMVLKQAELLRPSDPDLAKKKDLTLRKKLHHLSDKYNMDRALETDSQFINTKERMTPWSHIYRYPEDWKALSDRRLRATARREERETPENRRVRQQLEETVVSFTFNDQPVREAIEYLGTVGNVNVVLDESKLADPSQTLTLRLTNVSLETAIKLLTEQLGVKYVIRDGVVFISDDEGVQLPPETVVYEVRDLLAPLPEFSGQSFELGALSSSASGTDGGADGGIWGGGGGGGGGGGEEESESPEESLEKLIELVTQVIVPGTWEEGSGNAIRGRTGTIIVTHTPEVHRGVQQLLADLRKARAIQVMVDIRFVTVADAFLERIGINLGNATTPGIVYSDAHWNLDISSILGVALPVGGIMPATPVGATGFGLSGAFMDDVTVNFFLDAIQQSHRGNVMNAPRLTMMNGQRAHVAVSEQRNYVEDMTVEVAEGAVGYDPDIATVQDGIVFDVRPTVSADRRYVQLDLRPSVATIVSIDNFPILAGMVSVNIQLPRLQVSMVRCSVSVPDGGTLLVGGLSFGFEADAESGVPILSKIPIIGKAFSHRGISQEKRSLVILVKPTIIIQEEYEAAAQ